MPPQPQPPQPQGSLPCAEGQPLMPGEGHDLPTAPEAQWETVLSPQDRGARGERTVLGSSKAVAVALAQMVNKTLQQHNEAAKSMAPTGQWTFHKRKKDVGRLPADELLGELEKRGLTLDRNADAWSGTGEKGNNDKLKLLPHEGEEVVLDKQKLAEKLVRYDCGYHQGDTSAEKGEFVPGQACWGRFIGFGQQCGTPVGRLSEHEHKRCRTAQHYCETCLKSLCVPADRVHVVARKDAQAREGCYANGNQPVWTVSAGGQKFRSFNTHAPCKHEDISIVVWKEAPTADAESRAPAPQPIPPDWLHGEEGAKYVSLSYKGGSRDFEPTLIPQEEDPQEAGEAGETRRRWGPPASLRLEKGGGTLLKPRGLLKTPADGAAECRSCKTRMQQLGRRCLRRMTRSSRQPGRCTEILLHRCPIGLKGQARHPSSKRPSINRCGSASSPRLFAVWAATRRTRMDQRAAQFTAIWAPRRRRVRPPAV